MKVLIPLAAVGIAALGLALSRSTGGATGATAGVASTDETGAAHLVATDDQGRAVGGYDAVAYFTQARATPGDDAHTLQWRGAKWRFATAENLAAFQQDPQRYAPQYGGYCAWGVAEKNDLFPVDPAAWRVEGGKLYLNYNSEVQQQWLADLDRYIEQGDAKWPALQRAKTDG